MTQSDEDSADQKESNDSMNLGSPNEDGVTRIRKPIDDAAKAAQ